MKRFTAFFVFALLCFCCYSSAYDSHFEQRVDIGVGIQPLFLFADHNDYLLGNFHVICAGWDANYNGIYEPDSGDVKPSWWFIYHKFNTAKKLRDLEFDFPWEVFKPGIAYIGYNEMLETTMIFIPHLGRIRCFYIGDGSLVKDTVVNIKASAVSVAGDTLYISVRPLSGDHYVIVYNNKNKSYLDTITAGKFVSQTLPFSVDNRNYLAILNEGDFLKPNSTLQIIDLDNGNAEIKVLNVGGGGNHVSFNAKTKKLAVTSNMSHEVYIISTSAFEIMHVIKLPTIGYDGPRESLYSGYGMLDGYSDYISITSYTSNVYIYKLGSDSATLQYTLSSRGKTEGIASMSINWNEGGRESIAVANRFIKDTYQPDSTVSFWDYTVGVEEQPQPPTFVKLYPNPTDDWLTVEAGGCQTGESVGVELYSSQGILLVKQVILAIKDRITFDLSLRTLGLASGAYYLRITASSRTKAVQILYNGD